jgi:hypothetical protein
MLITIIPKAFRAISVDILTCLGGLLRYRFECELASGSQEKGKLA